MILAVLDYCGDDHYEFIAINSLEGEEEKNEEYLQEINPTGKIPTLKEKQYVLLSLGDMTVLNFICKTHPLCHKLYPREDHKEISKHAAFFNNRMRPLT